MVQTFCSEFLENWTLWHSFGRYGGCLNAATKKRHPHFGADAAKDVCRRRLSLQGRCVTGGGCAAGNGRRGNGRRRKRAPRKRAPRKRASRKRASRERERERERTGTGTGTGSGSGSGAGDAGPMPQGANAAGVYRVRVPIFPGCCRLRGPSAARRVPVRAPPS